MSGLAQSAAGLLLLAFFAGAQPSRAAESAKPLRVLVYAMTVSVGIVRHEARSGLGPAPTRMTRLGRTEVGGSRSRGSGDDASGGSVRTEGTISVDVVAATGDGGLVADLAESAPGRQRAKVRFAVMSDGTVTYDPKYADDASEEEIALARWLARGFYADRPQDVGAVWTIDQSGNGVSGLVVPTRATFAGHSRREMADAFDETDMSVVLTLASDSFAKRP